MSLGLAAPLWLLALAALALPLALHLLARGRGRRVRVGSVRLLATAPPRRPRRLQLQRPLLLLLRCLLLAAAVLALAGPQLRHAAVAAAPRRPWVLLDPAVAVRLAGSSIPAPTLGAAGAAGAGDPDGTATRPATPGGLPRGAGGAALPVAVRRAISRGAEVHLLATGLPARGAVGDLATLPDLATVPGGSWSLLRETAAEAPSGTPLLVVTAGRLGALRGERPALASAVTWYELPDTAVNRWPAGASASPGGRSLLVGSSDTAATTFRRQGTLAPGAAFARVPPGDAVAGDDTLRLAPPPRARVALLAAPGREADAGYLRAGLAAAAESAGVELELTGNRGTLEAVAGPAGAAAGTRPPGLVFWLADAPPPPALLAAARAGTLLVSDSGLPKEACGGAFLAVPATSPVVLHRCAGSGAAAGQTGADALALWRTAGGRAVLTATTLGEGRWLRFAGRFHPAWSSLVLSAGFPEWLRALLEGVSGGTPTAEIATSDRRSDGGQGAPSRAPATANAHPAPPPPSPSPERLLWLLLFPALVAERWLAMRR